ncbi:hypothetical protein [Ferrovibrio sp.]|uniref:DUF7033 domain-containing protein n=1 Tax=Ferrovibrio sp. TaxID=1917215 RepID=UPI0035B15F70
MNRTYRLSLGPDTRDYSPEIGHVCKALALSHGLRRADDSPCWLHYGAEPPSGAIPLPAFLFPQAVTIAADGLHLNRARLDAIAAQLKPRPDPRQFDAIGLIFLLQSRLEERDHAERDRYGRYPYQADFMVQQGLYGDAPADEALLALAQLITGEANPASTTSYRAIPTHDVDRLKAYHRPIEPLRLAAGDLLKRGKPLSAFKRLQAYASNEPWGSVRDLLDLSERHGLRSRFYLMGPSDSSYDSPYAASMPGLLHKLTDEIAARGHRLGFHPGFGTVTDASLWRRQRDGLEAAIGRPVREGRQHILSWRADTSPDIWNDAGMQADYSLGYPEAEGFRSGSCRTLPAYSLVRRQSLDLLQGSTPVMEFGLFGGKYRDCTPQQALELCRPIIATCRRFGGDLVLLYHTGQPPGPEHGAMHDFYVSLLQEAA